MLLAQCVAVCVLAATVAVQQRAQPRAEPSSRSRLQPRSHEFREAHLGMEVRFVLVHTSADSARFAAERAFRRVETLEAMLSDWRPSSEVSRLSSRPVGAWTPVSRELRELLVLAHAVSLSTDGAFDVTVGLLTQLWREAARTGRPIADSARARAAAAVGFRFVEVDSSSGDVRLMKPGMKLDLGAIAKGFILDEAARVLDSLGVRDMLLEAGGEIVTRGSPADAKHWRVTVTTPRGDTTLQVNEAAISTSSSRAQTAPWSREGHVIDPRTTRGRTDTPELTVLGTRAAITDALATGLAMMPKEKRAAVAARWRVTIVDGR